ncbi:MAG: hypothetical protein AB8G95_25710 [Anaerolineae bacterium]
MRDDQVIDKEPITLFGFNLINIITALIIGIVSIPFLCIFWAIFLFATGSSQCLDFASGQVPPEAEERFLKRIFEDTSNNKFGWISLVSDIETVNELKLVQADVSGDFEVIYGDDLAGTYDRILEFDNGLLLAVYYDGVWPECPDHNVTDAEIKKHLRLTGVSIRNNVDWLDR